MFSGTKRLIQFIVHSYMLEFFEYNCSGFLSDGGLTLLHVEQLRGYGLFQWEKSNLKQLVLPLNQTSLGFVGKEHCVFSTVANISRVVMEP